ncbi:nuclease-related domain-containing protein [Lactobacillus amylovorus]|uniref:nuclease-related domain-containing protein n=1 Tax=Lactobacillus amylovorus TaxID=1604 RepID=UPI00313E3D4B|nr:nuclease-related domain-containing protein [Lactobacillus amylovorus]
MDNNVKLIKFKYPIPNSIGMYAQGFRYNYYEEPEFKDIHFINKEHIMYTDKYGDIVVSHKDSDNKGVKHFTIYKGDASLVFDKGYNEEYQLLQYKYQGKLFAYNLQEAAEKFTEEFGKFNQIKSDHFTPWFDNNTQVPNDVALDSLRKTNAAARKFWSQFPSIDKKLPKTINAFSFHNIDALRLLNQYYKALNGKIDSAIKIGVSDSNTPHLPILSDDQLMNLSNKLAGEAGEELVDKAVKIDNEKFHNVILDYNYGNKRNTSANNQIDNIFITHTGIYCVEVKTRNVKTGIFDMRELADQGIKDQIGYHKDAVLNVLRDPNNHLKEILPKNLSSLIYNVVVIINRKEKDFQITNTDELTRFGAHILKAEDLNLAMTNGLKEDIYLTDDQIDKIAKVIERKNAGTEGERLYSDNILFFNDARKGNDFTLNEDDIVKKIIPNTYYTDILRKAVKDRKKEAGISEKQKQILDLIDISVDPFISNIYDHWTDEKYDEVYKDDDDHCLENPLCLPDVTPDKIQKYKEEFDRQKEEKNAVLRSMFAKAEAHGDELEARNARQREIEKREAHERELKRQAKERTNERIGKVVNTTFNIAEAAWFLIEGVWGLGLIIGAIIAIWYLFIPH